MQARIIFGQLLMQFTTNVLEHRHVETTSEDTHWRTHLQIVCVSLFKENEGKHGHQLMPVKCEALWGSLLKFQPTGWWKTAVTDPVFQNLMAGLTFSNGYSFLRKVLRVHICMNVFTHSDVQKPSCKIWHVIKGHLCVRACVWERERIYVCICSMAKKHVTCCLLNLSHEINFDWY
jgi:hypothetical protein